MKKILFSIAIVLILSIVFVYTSLVDDILTGNKAKGDWLDNMATQKLEDLVDTNYWSHTNSDGCNWKCRINKYADKSDYTWMGENLWKSASGGECNLEHAIKGWKKSPTHNSNLQHTYDREVLLTGSNDDYCYIVQIRVEK